MKYEEVGFRAVYRQFLVIPANDRIREKIKEYPHGQEAECVLGFGFCDAQEGLSVLVLATGLQDEKGFHFYDAGQKEGAVLDLADFKDGTFDVLDPSKGGLMEQYQKQIQTLDVHAVSEEIEKTRKMGFLDGIRDETRIDDVTVCLIREGLDPEDCTVRITGLGEKWIVGTLCDEPAQDFGYHKGDTIAFFARQEEDGSIGCFSDMTPDRMLTRADLQDGSLLREAIAEFRKDRTEDRAIEILQLLRDSEVWIPCEVELGKGPIMPKPDVLKNGEALFLPVFTDEASMREYGEQFTKVRKTVLEAMTMAQSHERGLYGIVVDPFTVPYVLKNDMFDVVRELKPRVID